MCVIGVILINAPGSDIATMLERVYRKVFEFKDEYRFKINGIEVRLRPYVENENFLLRLRPREILFSYVQNSIRVFHRLAVFSYNSRIVIRIRKVKIIFSKIKL